MELLAMDNTVDIVSDIVHGADDVLGNVRPYPEYIDNYMDKAVLRDFPDYYAHRNGTIFSRKTGRMLKYGKSTRGIGLSRDRKAYDTRMHIQVLMAFVQKPAGDYTVDHINCLRGDWHALCNLRWATKAEQRANQNRSATHDNNARSIVATRDGMDVVYRTIAEAQELGSALSISTAITKATTYNGHT